MVPQQLTQWRRPERMIQGELQRFPRRAGLTSIAAGGMNAHLIVEEYPQPADAAGQIADLSGRVLDINGRPLAGRRAGGAGRAQPAGSTSSLAGGMFLSSSVVSGQDTLIGVSQATPNNLLFGMNVDTVLATDSFKSSNFAVYPNPATDYLSFSTKNNVKIKQLRVSKNLKK